MESNKANNQHLGFSFEELIPEISKWNNGNGIDIADYICFQGNFEQAIAYGRFFWRDFTEFDDCIFISDGFSETSYRSWMEKTNDNKDAVQRLMNHRHITDLFAFQNPERNHVIYLGKLLQEIWQTKLQHEFPNKKSIIELTGEDDKYLENIQITIYQPHEK